MTAVSSPSSSSLSCSPSSSLSSPCHSSTPGRRSSVNIKAAVAKASHASAAKRKRFLSAAATQTNIDDTTMFDHDLAPRRRFKRRNSKCASMFYQMISPATLLELQRIAGETPPPATRTTQEPWGDEITTMTPVLLPSFSSMLHDKGRGRQSVVAGKDEEEEGSRWSCTQLRSQMPVTPRGPGSLCTAFPVSTTSTTTSTHSILAEALRLSSAHLDTMTSSVHLVDTNCGESTLAGDDDDYVAFL